MTLLNESDSDGPVEAELFLSAGMCALAHFFRGCKVLACSPIMEKSNWLQITRIEIQNSD
jgi:hypothetical protein